MPPFHPLFEKGSVVRIADADALEAFRRSWTYENPLEKEQLAHANAVAAVNRVRIYPGGDVLYLLEGVPGVWHEQCLLPCEAGTPAPSAPPPSIPRPMKTDMTPRNLKIAAIAAFALAAICCIYAWVQYDDNAAAVEYVNAGRWDGTDGAPPAGGDMAPAMPDAGRNALWFAAGLVVCGVVLLRKSAKQRA